MEIDHTIKSLVDTDDIILTKLTNSLNKSNNTLHKKAIVLVSSLSNSYTKGKISGIDGVKYYTKTIVDLILKLQDKDDIDDDTEANYEALIFVLSICLKQLPLNALRSDSFLSKVNSIITFALDELFALNYNIMKYSLIIIEKVLLSRTNEELSNVSNNVVKFYNKNLFIIINNSIKYINSTNAKTFTNLHKDIIKSVCKVISMKKNEIKYTILTEILSFIKNEITKMKSNSNNDNNESSNNTNIPEILNTKSNLLQKITQYEGEFVLKLLSSILQFLPFDSVNDLIYDVYALIEFSDNKHFIMNALLCIDVAFSTQKFTLESSEKFLGILLRKEILLSDIITLTISNDDASFDFKDKFIVAYIKAITQVLLMINTLNQSLSFQYFVVGTLTIFSELLLNNSEFVKGNVYNSLHNLINRLFTKDNIDNLINPSKTKSNNDEIDISQITLDKQNDNDNNNNNDSSNNGISVLEKVVKGLLYLLSPRFENENDQSYKYGYNLLLVFIEKINMSSYKQQIDYINRIILGKLVTLPKTEMLKIFIGKCFNYLPCLTIVQYYPLNILNYDLDEINYTDDSNVWIISFIDKFLKENSHQYLKDYVEIFWPLVNDLEHFIQKLKKAPLTQGNDIEMGEEDEDEGDDRFDINTKDTKHIRAVRIKRYELILTQVMNQIIKFTNFSNEYNNYISAFLDKFKGYFNKEFECYFSNLKGITFKFLYKVIKTAKKYKHIESINTLTSDKGLFFFQKILNLVLQGKLNKSEMQEGFNVINELCEILSQDYLIRIIIDMFTKFEKGFNIDTIDNNKNAITKEQEKEYKKLEMRLDIVNYLYKNIKYIANNPNNPQLTITNQNEQMYLNLSNSILSFVNKYFFKCGANSNIYINALSKRMFDILLTLLSKINDLDYAYYIYDQFKSSNGLNLISPKQKCKIFEFVMNIIIQKINLIINTSVPFEQIQTHFSILPDIALLTKDINRKVRNAAFDLIGKVTLFFYEKQLFNKWINMVFVSLLQSDNSLIISAGINTLARAFWEGRNDVSCCAMMYDNADVVLKLFENENKEIIKALFIYVRVLLYITKNTTTLNSNVVVNRVIHGTLVDMKENYLKDFKVKIRNLIKNLIMNFGVECVLSAANEKHHSLIHYVNKHLVKKIKDITSEEAKMHGYANAVLDNSVMLDNEENLIDEEEECINKEFKKIDKKEKDKETKITDKIDKLNIYDDDITEVQNQEKAKLNQKQPKDKASANLDKIEQLFTNDHVQLNNFFYVNPYAIQFNNNNNNDNSNNNMNSKAKGNDDVVYDTRKGKLIVKDLEKEMHDNKLAKKKKRETTNVDESNNKNVITKDIEKLMKDTKMKKVQNVHKDKEELLHDESDDDDYESKSKSRKRIKIDNNNNHTKGSGHYVKYSGDEYKNKKGKGDKIIKGKHDPFTYIQLNPKSLSKEGAKANMKIFEELMKNENK